MEQVPYSTFAPDEVAQFPVWLYVWLRHKINTYSVPKLDGGYIDNSVPKLDGGYIDNV